MASVDLLEELKLYDYYPQKLSLSEAIKLRGKSQNGCPKQYGLEIVRKLLMFDSTAVISVTTEINDRFNNSGNKEVETKVQCTSGGVRPQQKSNVRPSWKGDNVEQNERKLHPIDLLVVVMNCCDDFLRQIVVEMLFTMKLSIPILLPEVTSGSHTLLLFALRSLVPEVRDRTRKSSASLNDTLVDVRNPIVSFIRVGNLHRSKSKLVNDLLSFNSFNTFFHRECQNGSAKRLVSNGSIEAAWFQSETASEEEFNCRLLTALNLRGDARDYPKQTQFLCQSSTLVVFMVESFELFKELYENVLEDVDLSQTKIIVCYISQVSPDDVEEKYFEFLDKLYANHILSTVKYDWVREKVKMDNEELVNDLRKAIFNFCKAEYSYSNQTLTYTSIIRNKQNLGFFLDEDKFEYDVKASADEFVNLVLKQPPDCKPQILPLQSEPWEKIGKLEREQRGTSLVRNHDEHYIAEKEAEKRHQRAIQCRSLIQKSEITQTFLRKFQLPPEKNLLYYLNSCKIKLDARSRSILSNLLEDYGKEKHENHSTAGIIGQLSNEGGPDVKLRKMELKIANSAIGLEHILRELAQMYEAVISEEIRMREELKNAHIPPDVIHNFPTIVARLLLKGHPLELMDGDASNVPITWLKAVLDQINIMTNNAMVFVLSIIGVQSSGKSTLLNALFGLQFPVSAGRCTKGIYCHLVPVDKESLHAEYDYILVVDTEGLGASEFTGKSTFRDNELATFAIGLADATIINMKGENWAEIKDILQVVAHGLIRVRKTKAELGLMPNCMFVHQNVPAADAEEKNRLGQEKQLMLLDEAIKAAAYGEGFTDIYKFNHVIKYDPSSHSWYFPDLWNGRPPKATISQDYIVKTNELRHNLIQVMKDNPSKLRISSFFLRMSDLWNAMLHNDFVLCFRNTQQIRSGTFLNDRISHEVDGFKNLNKHVQTKFIVQICSFISIQDFSAQKERILIDVSTAVERNFTNMTTTVQAIIDATDIYAALKKKYLISLTEIKNAELRRIKDATEKDISVHMKKLEIANDQNVKDIIDRLASLEKCSKEVDRDKLNETGMEEFENSWLRLIADNERLVDSRTKSAEDNIKGTIREFTSKFIAEEKMKMCDWAKIFKTPLVAEMPQVTENDIVQDKKTGAKDFVSKANHRFYDAIRKWDLQFQNQRGLEFDGSHLEQVTLEVGQLLGILKKEHEVPAETDEMCLILPPGYRFKEDYIIKFVTFARHYTYNRSLENSKVFISMTDPLADIEERQQRSLKNYRQTSDEANIDDVSEEIFQYAKSSFVRNLGELIKTEVCNKDNENPTFKDKRACLRMILRDLGQRKHNLAPVSEGKQTVFEEFMSYVEMANGEESENFFLDEILKLLKEMLTKENAPETDFQKMVTNNVGKVVETAKNALKQAETNCKGCKNEYVQIFKEYMKVASEIDFRLNFLDGFTERVIEKVSNLNTEFLKQANSSFETLVCEENKAAIRPLFEKIMGCRERCPFCSAPCYESLDLHDGYHRANHYPTGMRGTFDNSGWIRSVRETKDGAKQHMKPRKLALDTCQTMVSSPINIRTPDTVQKYGEWYHSWFNWNYQSFKNYKAVAVYANWDIPYSGDPKTSLIWKWFMAQFAKELAEHYKALCPEIPKAWKDITWDEARKSLD